MFFFCCTRKKKSSPFRIQNHSRGSDSRGEHREGVQPRAEERSREQQFMEESPVANAEGRRMESGWDRKIEKAKMAVQGQVPGDNESSRAALRSAVQEKRFLPGGFLVSAVQRIAHVK
ncbi:hypothetical protein CDAR_117601 [Caerostris darwini]|uniref:Small VCP/p97-interacting protein n=1 Tax=Caerostris darwini TaxID=1538125 RepID=A0AAV4WM21_9ARAC|nr:hypothetical protein CDAR_117601 [Caerostris darwini]